MTSAIILAAGRGERLGRYTQSLPKLLVRVAGHTLLDWHIAALRACEVHRIVVVAGYRAERIPTRNVTVIKIANWESGGPVASLLAATPAQLDDPFLVLYGDCPHHPDNLRAVLARDAAIAVAGDRDWLGLWSCRSPDPLADAETYLARDGCLLDIGARAHCVDDIDAQFCGLAGFSRAGWRAALDQCARPTPPRDMTALLAALIADDEVVADVAIRGRWCEIDTASDLRLARSRLGHSNAWRHDWRTGTATR